MSSGRPEVNALIELAIFGGESYPSRVEDVNGDRLTVAAPLNLLIGDLPELGRKVTVRWPAGPRGRYALPAKVVELHHEQVATWDVEISGEAEIEQNRRFVRGGGGEQLRVRRNLAPEDPWVDSIVVDISERSIRGRFRDPAIRAGDPVEATFVLDDEVIEVTGSVLRVIDQPEPHISDVVLIFEPDEAQATAIRRYVMRQQLLARARAAND